MSHENREKTSAPHKTLTVIGTVLCVLLIPILIVNITLIIRSYTNADKVPTIGGYCPLIVLSGSMEPMIHTGDLIICKQIDAEQVKVDDVIAFFDPESNSCSVLTHKVIEVLEDNGKLSFRTEGVANNTEDRVAVSADKLVGIYTGKRIAGSGDVAMFMQTTGGPCNLRSAAADPAGGLGCDPAHTL